MTPELRELLKDFRAESGDVHQILRQLDAAAGKEAIGIRELARGLGLLVEEEEKVSNDFFVISLQSRSTHHKYVTMGKRKDILRSAIVFATEIKYHMTQRQVMELINWSFGRN